MSEKVNHGGRGKGSKCPPPFVEGGKGGNAWAKRQ